MKRPKLEEVLLSRQFNLDEKYSILKQADAKDAMNYAMSGDRDIVNILRMNDIWKYWFQRDLEIFYTNEIPGAFPRDGEQPIWKRWYLWIRFIVGMFQWGILQNQIFTIVYPQGSTFRYVNLNIMELKTPYETKYLDFRTEFPTIFTAIDNDVKKFNYDNFLKYGHMFSLFDDRHIVARYFPELLTTNNYDIRRLYAEQLSGTINLIFTIISNIYNEEDYDIIEKNPNFFLLKESPKIIRDIIKTTVIGCNACKSTKLEYKCSRCDKSYCSKKCARYDWNNKKCSI